MSREPPEKSPDGPFQRGGLLATAAKLPSRLGRDAERRANPV